MSWIILLAKAVDMKIFQDYHTFECAMRSFEIKFWDLPESKLQTSENLCELVKESQ